MPRKTKPNRQSVFGELMGDLTLETPSIFHPSLEGVGSTYIALDQIELNPKQPRRYHSPEAHESLVRSIKERGVIQAITVRKLGEKYELIAGERRVRAAKKVGETTIPAVVLEVDDVTALEISTLENMAREDLNPVEETEAVLHLLEVKLNESRDRVIRLLRQLDNVARGRSISGNISDRERTLIEAVFDAIGKFTPQSFVNNRLPILKFPPELYEAVMIRGLPFRTAQPIAGVKDETKRKELIEKAIAQKLTKEQVAVLVQQLQPYRILPRNMALEERFTVIKRKANQIDSEKMPRLMKLIEQIEKLLD
jgi:ParB family transcriptional regulator, chromosome partitioning protein